MQAVADEREQLLASWLPTTIINLLLFDHFLILDKEDRRRGIGIFRARTRRVLLVLSVESWRVLLVLMLQQMVTGATCDECGRRGRRGW